MDLERELQSGDRLAPMRRRSGPTSVIVAVLLCSGCLFGPSRERVGCLQRCARYKDSCILQATTADAIQACDHQGAACSDACPQ
jgi:hypothetical protein